MVTNEVCHISLDKTIGFAKAEYIIGLSKEPKL